MCSFVIWFPLTSLILNNIRVRCDIRIAITCYTRVKTNIISCVDTQQACLRQIDETKEYKMERHLCQTVRRAELSSPDHLKGYCNARNENSQKEEFLKDRVGVVAFEVRGWRLAELGRLMVGMFLSRSAIFLLLSLVRGGDGMCGWIRADRVVQTGMCFHFR